MIRNRGGSLLIAVGLLALVALAGTPAQAQAMTVQQQAAQKLATGSPLILNAFLARLYAQIDAARGAVQLAEDGTDTGDQAG